MWMMGALVVVMVRSFLLEVGGVYRHYRHSGVSSDPLWGVYFRSILGSVVSLSVLRGLSRADEQPGDGGTEAGSKLGGDRLLEKREYDHADRQDHGDDSCRKVLR